MDPWSKLITIKVFPITESDRISYIILNDKMSSHLNFNLKPEGVTHLSGNTVKLFIFIRFLC